MDKSHLVDDFVRCLQKCRKSKDLHAAKLFHNQIRENGLESHDIIGNYLVPTLVDCGNLPDAQQAFHKIFHPNEVSWTSLIHGYVDRGNPEHGLLLYQQMQDNFIYPSKYTFLVLLKACVKLNCRRRGHQIHCEVVMHGFDLNCFIGNGLVDMYAKCGALVESKVVFNSLVVRDVVSWNALITGYTENGLGNIAVLCLGQMKEQGMLPDITTFLCGLKACSNIGAIDCGLNIHFEVIKEEFERDIFISNTLVDMYAKCGLLVEAEAVFGELPIRDLVSWNALISGYAEHDYADKILTALQEMQKDGISPNTATFVRILQACSIVGVLEEGQEFHAEIVQRGFDGEFFVGNTLVDMYSKCGSFEDSRKVFDKLPERDVVSWNALIAGYSVNGYGEEALKCLCQMQADGVSPDFVTLSSALKACHTIGAIHKGREMHAEIVRKGYEGNLFAHSTLVDLYARCGSLQESQDVFDRLVVRDTVSWNALISGYADQGLIKEALDCLDQMRCEGMHPDLGTFVCSLQASCGIHAIGITQELHAEIIKEGFEGASCVNSALVNVYVKAGLLAAAQDVFDEQSSHEVISWTALIAGYAEEGLSAEASNCLEYMQREGVAPNAVTFISMLKASRDGIFDGGHEVHAMIVKMGFENDVCIGSALMSMYAKCGTLLEACEMFEKLLVQDVISWTALIGGYTEQGLGKEALSCLEEMQEGGFSPDVRTYIYCLQACGSVRAIDIGQDFHSALLKKGFEEDIYLGNALVDMYAKCGMLAELQEVFDKLPTQDLISWTSLIGGYAECGHAQEALDCFYNMQSKGIYPDAIAWNTIISGYMEVNECGKVLELFSRMQEEGFTPDSAAYMNIVKACKVTVALDAGKRISSIIEYIESNVEVALLEMYSKCGSMYDARKLFDSMSQKPLLVWNALIVGFAIQGETKLVLLLLEGMIESGIRPDGETFSSVLIVCAHACMLVESLICFEMMIEKFNIIPNIKHYTCIVDLLGRAGHLEDAILVLQEMPFQPDLVLLRAMLGACRKRGNLELGEEMFEFAVGLDEKHSGSYVLMSNIYVDHYMF